MTAATSAAQLARSTAAATRALHPAPLALDLLDSSDLDIKAVVSAHESDLEPDSDDPDRDSTRVARAKAAKRAAAAPAPAAGPSRDRGEDLQSEMRRLRAEAAARRVERSKVVEVLDSDEEERALEAEQEQLAAGPNLVRAPTASGKAVAGAAQDKGKGKGKGRKGKKGAQAKGRTLDEPSDEGDDAALKGLEAFKRSKKAGTAAAAPRASKSRAKGKSKAKDNIALFNPASDDDNLDSDGSLPSLADLQQRTEPRRRPPPPRPRTQPRPSTSKPLDARAQRRARTSGRSADAFINNSDDEREADRWGGGTVIATGGSGSGTVRLRGVRSRGRRLEERVEEEEEDEQDEPPPPRRRRARSASGSPAAQASPPTQDYSHLGIAPFVDPRAALARRKMRDEMSSPPTSAFSSSDGECDDDVDDDSSAARRRKKKKKGAADEFVELDKHMKRRKRQFRDERQPGYSNPRRN